MANIRKTKKIHTEQAFRKYGDEMYQQGLEVGVASGRCQIQKGLQDLLGLTERFNKIECELGEKDSCDCVCWGDQ